MTNFEKWKAGLTAEKMLNRYNTCPAFMYCHVHGSYKDCRKTLFEWANLEAEDDENCEKSPCPMCGEPAYIIKNSPEIYCKRCLKFYQREED